MTTAVELRLKGDDGVSNPDRRESYRCADPVTLRDQLNENWRQLRLMGRALADRDAIIGKQHQSIRARDVTIAELQKRLKLSNRFWPLLYAMAGGAVAETAKLLIEWILRSL
jgi:hypothetical protein